MDFEDPKHLVAAAQKIRDQCTKNAFSAPLSIQQQKTIRNDPVIGPLWVSKFSLPSSTDDTSRDALLQLIDEQNLQQVCVESETSSLIQPQIELN